MTTILRFAAAMLFAAMWAPPASAQESDTQKTKVEFRWLEGRAVKDLTDEKGFQTTCGPELSYAHKKPVLTISDVAHATLQNHGAAMGVPGDHFMITFRLTDEAKKKLVAENGDAKSRRLAIFIDGKYWSTAIFRKAQADKFEPFAGFLTSKEDAERVVEACRTR